MYSDNKRISDRQVFRQMVIVSLPLKLILFPFILQPLPLLYGLIIGLSVLLINILIIKAGENLFNKGKCIKKPLQYIIKARYIILFEISLIVLMDIIGELLLGEIHPLIILVATLIFVYFFTEKKIEIFARFTEILFYPIIIVTVLVLVLGITGIQLKNINVSQIFDLEIKEINLPEIILKIIICIFLFMPWDGFFICEEYSFKLENSNKKCIKAVIISWVIAICNLLVISFLPGMEYMSRVSYPFAVMLKIVGIPGGFLERQEALFGIFIVMAIVIEMAFYGNIIFNESKNKNTRSNHMKKICIYGAVLFLTMVYLGTIDGAGEIKRKIYTGVDVEDRLYVYSLGVDISDEELTNENTIKKYKITFENGDYSSYEGDIADIMSKYKKESVKQPDFTHIKVVVMGKNIWKNEVCIKAVKEFLTNNKISLNSIICRADTSVEETLEKYREKLWKDNNEQNSFGLYAGSILINNGYKYSNILYFQDITEQKGEKAVTKLPLLHIDRSMWISKTY